MQHLNTITLYLHIAAGFIALNSGLISMISQKGGKLHNRSGLVFYYSMMFVSISATYLSIIKSSYFLLHIGIFVFYQTFSAYRAVKIKSLQLKAIDFAVVLVAAANCVFMISNPILILKVFGVLCSTLLIGDVRLFKTLYKKQSIAPLQWLKRHIGFMMGAYISTLTAFLVNIYSFPNSLLVWLGPTIVFTPLSIYFTKKYTTKTVKA